MTQEATRRTAGLYRALERDADQFMKAVHAIQDGRMKPFESILLAQQLNEAHKAWLESFAEAD